MVGILGNIGFVFPELPQNGPDWWQSSVAAVPPWGRVVLIVVCVVLVMLAVGHETYKVIREARPDIVREALRKLKEFEKDVEGRCISAADMLVVLEQKLVGGLRTVEFDMGRGLQIGPRVYTSRGETIEFLNVMVDAQVVVHENIGTFPAYLRTPLGEVVAQELRSDGYGDPEKLAGPSKGSGT